MIDFSQFTEAQFNAFKDMAQKVYEKSPMERDFFIFDQKTEASARIYCFGIRSLMNVYNCTDEGELKESLKKEITANQETYAKICDLLNLIEKNNLFAKLRVRKLFHQVHKPEVLEVIDMVGILVEKTRLIDTSIFKGILYEGKSKEAFDKVNQEFEHV